MLSSVHVLKKNCVPKILNHPYTMLNHSRIPSEDDGLHQAQITQLHRVLAWIRCAHVEEEVVGLTA